MSASRASLRALGRTLRSQRPLASLRTLHSTAPSQATPFGPGGQAGPAPSELPDAARHAFEKVAKHEGAKSALKEIAGLMQKKGRCCWLAHSRVADQVGIDMTQKPSTMQLLKLGTDPELKNAALKVDIDSYVGSRN